MLPTGKNNNEQTKKPCLLPLSLAEETRGRDESLFNFVAGLPISPPLPNHTKSQIKRQTNVAINAKSNSNIKEEQPRKTQPLTSIKKRQNKPLYRILLTSAIKY